MTCFCQNRLIYLNSNMTFQDKNGFAEISIKRPIFTFAGTSYIYIFMYDNDHEDFLKVVMIAAAMLGELISKIQQTLTRADTNVNKYVRHIHTRSWTDYTGLFTLQAFTK